MQDKRQAPTVEDPNQNVPFFARFLEGQDTPETCEMTLKYPSDRDEIDFHHEYESGNSENFPPHK